MNILVLNGSPKGENSVTMILTQAFLAGLTQIEKPNVEIVDLSKKNIQPCLGCEQCWINNPNRCVIRDDMHKLLYLLDTSDVVVWSFPLHHYGVPSKMKAFLDRTLPICKPSSYNKGKFTSNFLDNQKHVLISSSGYIWSDSYIAVNEMFKSNFGEENIETIFFKGLRTFLNEESPFIDNYLSIVKKAGEEYFLFKKFSIKTKKLLSNINYDEEKFYSSVADYFQLGN